jgi:hypothetical protein
VGFDGNPERQREKERDRFEDLSIDGKIIVKWISKE